MRDILIASKKPALEHYREEHDNPAEAVPSGELRPFREGYDSHYTSVEHVEDILDELGLDYEREYASNIEESPEQDLVIGLGGDGTILETASNILDTTPLLPVRSDEGSHGGLCTYDTTGFRDAVTGFVEHDAVVDEWTRLEGKYRDTTEIALNEVFIGAKYTMKVARYTLDDGQRAEEHMNSGLIAATGAGSTGWYGNIGDGGERFPRDAEELRYTVREPINPGGYELDTGRIDDGETLTITSKMNVDGIISFDGDKDERMYDFPRGETLQIGVSDNPLRVVT